MTQLTEKNLQNYLREKCKKHKIIFHKLESRSSRGFPDVMLAKSGKIIFLELKSPKKTGRLHPLQQKCLNDLLAEGLDARVADSKAAVDKALNDLCK